MTGRPGLARGVAAVARARAGRRRTRAGSALPGLVLAVALVGGVLLGGCTSARNDLGTADSECYVAIPAATAAVHGAGRLAGVRLVTVSSLRLHSGVLYRAARDAPGPRTASVCLVAFSGRFSAGQVTKPVGDLTGHLAVVALGFPDKRLLATLLAGTAPLPFGHSHIGLL